MGACTLTTNAQGRYVDYRYAPQGHVSTTAFPDDRYKTIVGPQGQLLYEFGKGRFFTYLGDGFKTAIHMMADENQKFEADHLLSARIPVVVIPSTLEGGKVEQFIYSTTKNIMEGRKIVNPLTSDREDIILTKVYNKSAKPRTIHPVVYVKGYAQEGISCALRGSLYGSIAV